MVVAGTALLLAVGRRAALHQLGAPWGMRRGVGWRGQQPLQRQRWHGRAQGLQPAERPAVGSNSHRVVARAHDRRASLRRERRTGQDEGRHGSEGRHMGPLFGSKKSEEGFKRP
eukprot:scaffold39397_cov60-Phaeocystis_antarctica.AAC.2